MSILVVGWLSVSLLLSAIAASMLPKAAHAAEAPYAPYAQLTADDYWSGEVIGKLKEPSAAIGAFSASSLARSVESFGIGLEPIELWHEGAMLYRTSDDVLSTLEALAQDPRVEYVQPRYITACFEEMRPIRIGTCSGGCTSTIEESTCSMQTKACSGWKAIQVMGRFPQRMQLLPQIVH